MLESFCIAAQLAASQEGHSSMSERVSEASDMHGVPVLLMPFRNYILHFEWLPVVACRQDHLVIYFI
jgi:hypothetical protein